LKTSGSDRSVVNVIQYGLGSIGMACARAVAATPGLRLVGAVDVDPEKIGRSLARLLDLPPKGFRGIAVRASLAEAMAGRDAHVAMHTTVSSLGAVVPQIQDCLRAGLAVVSSTEELAFPSRTDPEPARRLDVAAKRARRAAIGTGVNPGFIMDLIPIVASGASLGVRKILVRRVLDAGRRRAPFQKKVGVGMAPADVRRRLAEESMGHVGLLDSALLIAAACGIEIDEVRKSGAPVLATRPMRSALGRVARGKVIGLRQNLSCRRKGREVIRMEMVMVLGAKDPRDESFIDGSPRLHLRWEGGVHGDAATIATLINAIPRALTAPPGLHNILTLPIPRTFSPLLSPQP